VLVDPSLADEIGRTLASLEDRRLWSGSIAAVHQVVWGPPGKTWTARKDQESWKITGPDQAATQQPAARLELALWNFQKLEELNILSSRYAPKGPPVFVLELLDQAGKPLLHLEEVRAQGKDRLAVRTGEGKTTSTALIPQAPFRQWQAEMQRLTVAAEPAGTLGEKGEGDKGSKK
jgi:hypothetical protein